MDWIGEWRPPQVGHEFSSGIRITEGVGGRGIMLPQEEERAWSM